MYEIAILYCISIWNLFISIKGVWNIVHFI
jgi:hypothetical protein